MTKRRGLIAVSLLALLALAGGLVRQLYVRPQPVPLSRAQPAPEALRAHCRDVIGPPRVVPVGRRILVAIGHDLANTIAVRTDAGLVVVDAGMNLGRAAAVRQALAQAAGTDQIAAIIYTHSHIDHVGGAAAWASADTPIWATAAFTEHFFKQYGVFRPAEASRGAAQFGWHVPDEALPCSALGRRPDLAGTIRSGVRLPTRTFAGLQRLQIGGVPLELHEAHGETHDQLFVWLPDEQALLPGDNYYQAFPNLYTIRGTSPRPVDAWIDSLDRMRRLSPQHLVPSHTGPVSGAAEVAARLTRYRDGIQWVRDRVVQAGNRGDSLEGIAREVGLPPHLSGQAELQETYGQVDWSARALYTNHLGWFDGRPEALYPLPEDEQARRTVALMGGPLRVAAEAQKALSQGDAGARWAAHLLGLLRALGPAAGAARAQLDQDLAAALGRIADGVGNSNGRAYLLEAAHRLAHGAQELPAPQPDEALIDAIPLPLLFQVMETRLRPELSLDVHESVRFELDQAVYFLTVRRGVAERAEGTPLPGTPAPLAVVRASGAVWRRLALQVLSPAQALRDGRLKISGDALGFVRFLSRFRGGT